MQMWLEVVNEYFGVIIDIQAEADLEELGVEMLLIRLLEI